MFIPGSLSSHTDDNSSDEDVCTVQSLRLSSGAIHRRRRSRPDGKLRVVIVCENVMPKVDGVTRTLSRLLQHLHDNGHQALVLCPDTPLNEFASTPLLHTAGIPVIVYPELKLNFVNPAFLQAVESFDPDIIHLLDPIWLGAQMLWAFQLGWAGPSRPIVASYHTNISTYLRFFGFAWLENWSWELLREIHYRCSLTACPSQSIATLLSSRKIVPGEDTLRIWPRGVDTITFNPRKRTALLRQKWLASTCETCADAPLLPTPPPSPGLEPADSEDKTGRCVILYVGRISYEKNLLFLLYAYLNVRSRLEPGTSLPRLVLVGDGPARLRLEELVKTLGLEQDVIFEGHIGEHVKLAEYYASADIFAFPSYTETFGQVVCEALASGLPVVGLDAPGTRDLVVHEETGLLLPNPFEGDADWCSLLQNKTAEDAVFESLAIRYAVLLEQLICNISKRKIMGRKASLDGTRGRSWYSAMECIVDCYREAVADSATPKSGQNSLGTRCILFISMGLYHICRAISCIF